MTIRHAELEDQEAIGELLIEARGESANYNRTPYSEARGNAFIWNFLRNPKGAVFVDDDINMVLFAEVRPDWITTGYTATAYLIYARPGHNGLKLVKHFERWAKEWPGVDRICLETSFTGDRADAAGRLFQRLGFEVVGQKFVRMV